MATIAEQKNELRKKLKKALSLLTKIDKHRKSKAIMKKLMASPFYAQAQSVLIFASTENEPYTWHFINHPEKFKKEFYLPSASKQRVGKLSAIDQKIVKSEHNIFEPTNTVPVSKIKHIDLIIVPGLGFDRDNNRIGHGVGWYDRALKALPAKRVIGLCFKEQIAEHIPTAEFDVKVDEVITD